MPGAMTSNDFDSLRVDMRPLRSGNGGPSSSYALSDATDVQITNIINDQIIKYDDSISKWINVDLANLIQTSYIADLAIITSKIADNAITTAKIADNQITTSKIADAQITDTKLSTISYSKLNLSGSIVNTDISASAAIAKSKLAALNIVDADVSSISWSKIDKTGSVLADIANVILTSPTQYDLLIRNASGQWINGKIDNQSISSTAGITSGQLAQITDKTKLPSATFYTDDSSLLKTVFSPILSSRKWGALYGVVATPLSPLSLPITAASTQGSAVGNFSQSMGRYLTHTTGTTAGNNSGGKTGTNLFQRYHNPYFAWRGRTITTKTTGTLTSRFYVGMTSDASNDPGNSDTLNDAKSCFLFGYRSTDTNYQIIRNDGSTPATYTDTGIPIDTAVRKVELFGDDSGARFGYRINGGSITWYTTSIPAQTTWMGAYWMMTTTDTVAKAFDNIAVYVEFDSM